MSSPTPREPVIDDPARMTPVQRVQVARLHRKIRDRIRAERERSS